MQTPDLRMAILREMASIRHELAEVESPRTPPLAPLDFRQQYIRRLRARLAELERECDDAEQAAG